MNGGFGALKKAVPNLKSKCSKVETLKEAINYIKFMRGLLGLEDIKDDPSCDIKMEFGDGDGE